MEVPHEEELMQLDSMLYELHQERADPFAGRMLQALTLAHNSRVVDAPFLGFRYSKFWSEDTVSPSSNQSFSAAELV